jgi:serine phosphatase RsbU (regulator of sigma subunit)
MRRELVDARRLHEALFPSPLSSGPLRFGYLYEPMRQIGGDYVFDRPHPQPRAEGDHFEFFNMLLVDVTGHGIAAALTVNRLHGEIERLFAENPEIGPGEILSALNRYVHLTLANHSIYVTALCLRVDLVGGVIEYASGGHPPAFIARGVMSGRSNEIEQLESTSVVLGACAAGDFDPGVRRVPFAPGDTLIAYTDGAIETRNAENRMLGLKGLRECLETATLAGAHLHGFAPAVLQAVEKHRSGPVADDTLIVEIRRPLEIPVQTRPAAEFVGVS